MISVLNCWVPASILFSHQSTQIPIFEGEHYDYGSSQIEIIFISQELWHIVEGYEEQPQAESSLLDYCGRNTISFTLIM